MLTLDAVRVRTSARGNLLFPFDGISIPEFFKIVKGLTRSAIQPLDFIIVGFEAIIENCVDSTILSMIFAGHLSDAPLCSVRDL